MWTILFPRKNYKEEHQLVTHDGSMEMILTQSHVKMYFYKPKMSCIINLIFLQDSTPHHKTIISHTINLICLKNSTLQSINQEWVVWP